MARRSKTGFALVVVAVLLVACSAPTTSTGPAHASAVEACQAQPGSGWQVAASIERASGTALALHSGTSVGTCLASRDGVGFGSASLGVGGYQMPSPAAFSYLSAQRAGDDAVMVGRIPSGVVRVRLTLAGGSTADAAIGTGIWVAWLTGTNKVTLIEALDASGASVARIQDENGVQPKG